MFRAYVPAIHMRFRLLFCILDVELRNLYHDFSLFAAQAKK